MSPYLHAPSSRPSYWGGLNGWAIPLLTGEGCDRDERKYIPDFGLSVMPSVSKFRDHHLRLSTGRHGDDRLFLDIIRQSRDARCRQITSLAMSQTSFARITYAPPDPVFELKAAFDRDDCES